jgi:hypothetical protein
MPLPGFEPAIPAREWLQAHALDRAATVIGKKNFCLQLIFSVQFVYLPVRYLNVSTLSLKLAADNVIYTTASWS